MDFPFRLLSTDFIIPVVGVFVPCSFEGFLRKGGGGLPTLIECSLDESQKIVVYLAFLEKSILSILPVVPHKAVAEVSRRGKL